MAPENHTTQKGRDWICAGVCGGLATAPIVIGIIGWTHHWNAYTNLSLTLGSFSLWATLVTAWRQA